MARTSVGSVAWPARAPGVAGVGGSDVASTGCGCQCRRPSPWATSSPSSIRP